jgi:hypothetical protein
MSTEPIKCPTCETVIDIDNVISERIKAKMIEENNVEMQKQRSEIAEAKAKLAEDARKLEETKAKENELFQQRVQAKLKEELAQKETELKKELSQKETELKKKVESETSDLLNALKQQLNDQSEKLKEFYKKDAEIEQLKREKSEAEDRANAEAQKRINEIVAQQTERIQKESSDKSELQIKELHKQLEDQKKLTEEMQRKQNQGSMQLQGEVQELAMEEFLRQQFPLDSITEIKKGARGADCVQVVNTYQRQNCGTIYYESKRTKDFSKTWIEKFKEDIRENNANIGILVTDAMPTDMPRLGIKEGIWICSFEEFKGLCNVLRENIIALDMAIASQENKGDKMSMLYTYLTSNEFKLQVEGIIEGYVSMEADLQAEKRAMNKLWKKREKQLQKVLDNTTYMYGSLQGIAGSAIQNIKTLELPGASDDDVDIDLDED